MVWLWLKTAREQRNKKEVEERFKKISFFGSKLSVDVQARVFCEALGCESTSSSLSAFIVAVS